MTKEDKQLLLKDLCSRLPYGVVCYYNCVIPIKGTSLYKTNWEDVLRGIVPIPDKHIGFMVGSDKIDALEGDIKPYLRPMSSMTEEEKEEYRQFLEDIEGYAYSIDCVPQIDWLNAHHFDYRGLIPMGLALKAPMDMYKTD